MSIPSISENEKPSSVVPASLNESLSGPVRTVSIQIRQFNKKSSLNVPAPIVHSFNTTSHSILNEGLAVMGDESEADFHGEVFQSSNKSEQEKGVEGNESTEQISEKNGKGKGETSASVTPISVTPAATKAVVENVDTSEEQPVKVNSKEETGTPVLAIEVENIGKDDAFNKSTKATPSAQTQTHAAVAAVSITGREYDDDSSSDIPVSQSVQSAHEDIKGKGKEKAIDTIDQSALSSSMVNITSSTTDITIPLQFRTAPPPPVTSTSSSSFQDDFADSPPSSPVFKDKGKGRAPPIPEKIPLSPPPQNTQDPNGMEAEWRLKTIIWPPRNREGRTVRIITQNENGPCSLLALCNILILRYQISITPPDRPSVTYSYLSSLVAQHLLNVLSNDSAPASLDLDSALSILPKTQYGLDVNVRFASVDGFKPLGDGDVEAGELALFRLAGVELLHGWVADPQDEETWEAVVERAGDYDVAVQRLAEGDDISKGLVVAGDLVGEEELEKAVEAKRLWTKEQQEKVRDAMLIRSFLDSSSTQLTYPGLTQLHDHLMPGDLCALFRNSHLSVLLRKPIFDHSTEDHGAQLFTLATDASFVDIEEVAWESLADVDGSTAEYYDGDFVTTREAKRRRREQERREREILEQVQMEREREEREKVMQGVPEDADADLQLAYRLQREEYAADDEQRRRREEERTGYAEALRINEEQYQEHTATPSSRWSVDQGSARTPYGWEDPKAGGKKKKEKKKKHQNEDEEDKDKKCCIM